jgi:drug/metabolite transporter (DMT)-like permease
VTEPTKAPLNLGLVAAGIAACVWGLSGVVAKDITMGGIAIGAYRFGLYGLTMTGVGWFSGARIDRKVLRSSLWGGLALGADVTLFFTAVKLTTIVNATIIGALQPVVVSIVAAKVFGELITRRDIAYGLVAVVGVLAVALGSTGQPAWNIWGDLAAVGALLSWSAYFVANRMAKDKGVSPRQYTICTALYTSAIAAPLALIFGQSLAFPSLRNMLLIAALAFGAGIFGHEMMNWALQRIPMWLASTFTLVVPVVSAIAAWIFLDEPLNALQIVAMGVVLFALAQIVTGQSTTTKKRRPLRR